MSEDLVTWLRKQVTERLGMARYLTESEAASAEWHEPCSGVLVTGPPTHDDTWDGTHALGDSRLTRFIAANDPRDTIARCEAELAILDACLPGDSTEAALENGDISTEEYVSAEAMSATILRLLASGYRHRAGYREEWKP